MTTLEVRSVMQQLRLRTDEVGTAGSSPASTPGVWDLIGASPRASWPGIGEARQVGNGESSSNAQQGLLDATPNLSVPGGSPGADAGTVEPDQARSSIRVQAAIALRNLTRLEAVSEEDWLQTAEVFRRTFRKLRLTEPRHADLTQIVSDALRFTSRAGFSDFQTAMEPLERAGEALLESFIPTETELQIQKDLLAKGWRLTRPYTGRALAP